MHARILTAGFLANMLFCIPAMAGEWIITNVNGIEAEGETEFRFGSDGSISGSTGCNRFIAQGQIVEGRLEFTGPAAMTRMACPGGGLMAQEDALTKMFDGPVALAFDPFKDELVLSAEGLTVVLAPAAGGN